MQRRRAKEPDVWKEASCEATSFSSKVLSGNLTHSWSPASLPSKASVLIILHQAIPCEWPQHCCSGCFWFYFSCSDRISWKNQLKGGRACLAYNSRFQPITGINQCRNFNESLTSLPQPRGKRSECMLLLVLSPMSSHLRRSREPREWCHSEWAGLSHKS